MLAFQGFTLAINGIGAPFIARDFGLDDTGIAGLYAFVASAAFGVLALSRLADRVGRRRVVLASMTATSLAAVAAAVTHDVVVFAVLFTLLNAFVGATVSGAVVLLSEALPTAGRARGQGYGGIVSSLGAGLCLILMPLLEHGGYSWRWLLVLSGLGLVTVPVVAWALPESGVWERAAVRGGVRSGHLFDLFRGPHRSRAVPLLVCTVLSVMAATSADAWSYYHAVSVVGLSAAVGSAVVLVGGALGLVGFPVGAWGCDRFGRVPTVAVAWLVTGAGSVLYYAGPSLGLGATSPLQLGLAFFVLFAGFNAAMVGFRAAATELFPTALRGTVIGWTALLDAVGTVASQAVIAVLSGTLGGLSVVVGAMALLVVPAAVIFLRFVDETRGVSLDRVP